MNVGLYFWFKPTCHRAYLTIVPCKHFDSGEAPIPEMTFTLENTLLADWWNQGHKFGVVVNGSAATIHPCLQWDFTAAPIEGSISFSTPWGVGWLSARISPTACSTDNEFQSPGTRRCCTPLERCPETPREGSQSSSLEHEMPCVDKQMRQPTVSTISRHISGTILDLPAQPPAQGSPTRGPGWNQQSHLANPEAGKK